MKSIKFYIILIVFLIILTISLHLLIKLQYNKKTNKQKIPDVKFPFKNIKNEKGVNMNIIAITAPFRSDKDKDDYNKYVRKYNVPVLGVTSYLNFPGIITHPHDDQYYKKNFKKHDYINSCIGWCHCFKNPLSRGLDNKKTNMLLLSESDFVNQSFKPNKQKDYDFIYICLQDNEKCTPGWQSVNRNWELAKKCFPIMCEKFNLNGLLVGRLNCNFTPKCKNKLTIIGDKDKQGKIDYYQLMEKMSKCKFLFLPNIRDASPRVLTEALVVDVPVLVNKKIYGGTKYVNENTGELFSDEKDLPKVLEKMLFKIKNNKYNPRKWFTKNYSKEKTGKKLYKFIKKIYPEVWDAKYVSFTI